MKLTLPSGLLTLAVVAGMALPPFDADAGYGKIYLLDSLDPYHEYTAPIVQNEEYYVNRTLEEVEPDVYEGIVNYSSSNFWFSKQLYDCSYEEYRNNFFYRDLVTPKNIRSQMHKIGNLNAFTSSDVYDVIQCNQTIPSWFLNMPDDYRMVLDLNENALYAIQKGSFVVVTSQQPKPTLATLNNYRSANETFYTGNTLFQLYDLFTGQWLNAPEEYTVIHNSSELKVVPSSERGYCFTMDTEWYGGTISISGGNELPENNSYYISLTSKSGVPLNEAPHKAEALQFTGDFNNWGIFENAVDCSRSDSLGLYWIAELPVGTDQFLFLEEDWIQRFGLRSLELQEDGSYIAYLSSDPMTALNFSFDHPLTKSIKVLVDLSHMTAHFPAETPFSSLLETVTPNTEEDVLYVVTPHDAIKPWKGMPTCAADQFQKLRRIPGTNSYSGTINWTASYEQNDGIAFVKELTISGEPNYVVVPALQEGPMPAIIPPSPTYPRGEDMIVSEAYGNYYTRARVVQSDDFNYFCLDSSLINNISSAVVTVNFDNNPTTVDFIFPEKLQTLYLVGTPNDWSISESDALPFERIADDIYYGKFTINPEEQQSFRFFKKLGKWDDSNSVGSTWSAWNTPSTEITDNFQGISYVGGAGNWLLEAGEWPSNDLYILVDLSSAWNSFGEIYIASQPIDIEDFVNRQKIIYYPQTMDNGEVYFGKIYLQFPIYDKFVIAAEPGADIIPRTRILPFSPNEPEWLSSYSISMADDQSIEYDGCGIAEFDLKIISGISTERINPIHLTPEYTYHPLFQPVYSNLYLDLDNLKGYIERQYSRIYIVGDMTEIDSVRFNDRHELYENSVDYRGGLFYFPPGNPRFSLVYSLPSIYYYTSSNNYIPIDIKKDPLQWAFSDIYNASGDVVLENWEGGNLLVAHGGVYDPNQIKSLVLHATGLGETADSIIMTRDDKSSLIFRASVPYYVSTSDASLPSLTFNLNIYDLTLPMGNGVVFRGYDRFYYTHDDGPITEINNIKRLGLNTTGLFQLPTLKGSGVLNVTVNIEDMTLTVDFSEAESGNVYEVVSVGNPAIDGVEVYPALRRENAVAVELDLNTAAGEPCEFNFTSAQGDVIVPAEGESEIVFGDDGFWIGNYTTVPSTRARARGVARAKETSKWNVNLPEYVEDKINFLIDETEKKMVAYSSDCNTTTFYMEVKNNGRETNAAAIDVYDTLSTLVKDDDGIYRGSFEVEAQKTDVPAEVLFVKELSNTGVYTKGIFNCETSQSIIDITNEKSWDGVAIDSQFGEPVTPSIYRFSSDERMKVEVEYDPMTNAICFNPTFLGVDEVAATDNAVSVYGAHGCLVVSAGSPATLTVYNLQGMAVKTVAVGESTLRIPLSPGLYIVAGKKVVVK